jgi:hypothetical protein
MDALGAIRLCINYVWVVHISNNDYYTRGNFGQSTHRYIITMNVFRANHEQARHRKITMVLEYNTGQPEMQSLLSKT